MSSLALWKANGGGGGSKCSAQSLWEVQEAVAKVCKEAIWQSWVVLGPLCPTLLQLIAQLTFIALFRQFWLRLPQKPKPCHCITGVNWFNGAFVKSLLTQAGVNLSQFTRRAFRKSSYASLQILGPRLHATDPMSSKRATLSLKHTQVLRGKTKGLGFLDVISSNASMI